MANNKTMMQFFEWYMPEDSSLWRKVKENSKYLSDKGITSVWLPPAYKGVGGVHDVGYGVYDLYDLGEFDQKGSIPTKYGTKDEYLEAIQELKLNNIQVIADIVLNHKLGADETEEVFAIQEDIEDRNVSLSEAKPIRAWTKYTFPGRGDKYSDFKWNWTHFHGVDWDEESKTTSLFKFYGKHWDENVDKEFGNFDYLMGADIDLNNVDVILELKKWGLWYLNFTGVDGFRLDAIKHIRAEFFPDWLGYLREQSAKNIYAVGEYWGGNVDTILQYLDQTNYCMQLFDVPLHFNFFSAAQSNGQFDMSKILEDSLLVKKPEYAVTFVDNHDTEPGQALESNVLDWFKPIAYSLIMLHQNGTPCIFYGDYYGVEGKIECHKEIIDKLLKIRKYCAYGEQIDYFDHDAVVGYTRLGDYDHPDSGLALICSDYLDGEKVMNVGKNLANTCFYDALGNVEELVWTDEDGNGCFKCDKGSVSVWIKKCDRNN